MSKDDSDSYLTKRNLLIGAVALGGAAYLLSGSGEDKRKIDTSPELLPEYGPGPHRVINRDAEIPIKKSPSGIGTAEPETIVDVFKRAVERNPDAIAWRREPTPGNWETCTWKQHWENCVQMAKSLIAVGINQHDTVNIIGFNSYQWITASLGCQLAGGISAGQYTTNNSGQCKYIAEHSGAKVIFLENAKQLAKWEEIHAELPDIKCIVVWDGSEIDAEKFKLKVYSYDDFIQVGSSISDDEVISRFDKIKPGHCAGLIYTSGTTGNPKAVMMSHDNFIWTFKSFNESVGTPDDFTLRVISYLPLSHVAAQIVDIIAPLVVTADERPGELWFARPDALKGSLKLTLAACRPTFFFGVPRVWEKFKAAIQAKAKEPKGAVMGALVSWAKGKCYEKNTGRSMSQPSVSPFGYGLASKVMGKVKAALGLDQCVMCLTGAAPISRDTLEYFKNLDIFIHEVYGMSESGGPTTCNRLYHRETGTTGPALNGIEVKLDHVPDRDKKGEGEICFRGRSIMMGYLGMETKTREAIDDEGFMHSGDVGSFDESGCLSITGRIKELLITEGGENIAPVPIEHYIKSLCPALSNVIMIGDRRKYCTCLISLKTKIDPETEKPTDMLDGPALDVSNAKTVQEAKEDTKWKAYIEDAIKTYNSDEEFCVSRAQKLQYFRILPEDLSRPQGTLGPTLKIKRSVVTKIYSEVIESMYQK